MDSDWEAAMEYNELREVFAAVTGSQSESTYITLSFNSHLVRKLKTKRISHSTCKNPNLQNVSMAMKHKVEEYEALLVFSAA